MPRPPLPFLGRLVVSSLVCLVVSSAAYAQEAAAPPAYLAVVEGIATLERDGDVQPAVRNMPFVTGDRLRTEAGRVEIDFPDGTAIEVAPYSEVEALSPTRVRVLAGSIDHVARSAETPASAAYLPQDLQQYGSTLDQNGSWQYTAPYGDVWYPTVAPRWRPYYYGSWSSVPSYGWTWVGLDAFSWPTHHYGRWGYARNAWFWIPGRSWSSAWVSWGVATDYVGWCPLGFDGRPVFALSIGSTTGARAFQASENRASTGWTVMARSDFGDRGAYAHTYSVDSRHFDARTPFIETSRAPVPPAHARARVERREPGTRILDRTTAREAVAPPARPAGLAVPRGSAPELRPTTHDDRPTNDFRPHTTDYPPTIEGRPPTIDHRPRPNDSRPLTTGSHPVERPAERSAAPSAGPAGAVPPGAVPPGHTVPPSAAPPGHTVPPSAAPPGRTVPPSAAPPGAMPQERAVPRSGAQPSGKSENAGAKRPR
jgi:hypothetical protein